MKLIDKDKIVAEIKRRIDDEMEIIKKYTHPFYATEITRCNARVALLKQLQDFLNTLEVKEVDLEKEINKYISDNFFGSETMGFFATRTKEEPNDIDIALCAKHFFKLGLKSK